MEDGPPGAGDLAHRVARGPPKDWIRGAIVSIPSKCPFGPGGPVVIAGLIIGVLGTVLSAVALVYAALAAHRSEALLRRMVVYPFRELDVSFAALNDSERSVLLRLYSVTLQGALPITPELIGQIREDMPDLSSHMLNFLTGHDWLAVTSPNVFRLNRDRLPYLHFIREAQKGIES